MTVGGKQSKAIKRTLKVGPSRIHGTGLFASDPIAADTVLGHLRTRKARRDGPYVLTTDAGAYRVLCKLRYINHSKTPNVAYVEDLTVVALRDIVAGEELTHDYGDDWD